MTPRAAGSPDVLLARRGLNHIQGIEYNATHEKRGGEPASKGAAIRLLSAVVDDPKAALYLEVQAARSLLQVKPEAKPEDEGEPVASAPQIVETIDGQEFIRIEGRDRDILLPSNGRRFVREERLKQLAEMLVAADDEAEPVAPTSEPVARKPTGKERLKLVRAKRKAIRAAPAETETRPKAG